MTITTLTPELLDQLLAGYEKPEEQDLPAAEAAAAGVLPCSSAFVVRSDI